MITVDSIHTYSNVVTPFPKRPHAEYGPSKLKDYEACPSYKSRSGTNPIAEAGTRVHEAIEKEDPTLLVDEVERSLAEWCLSFLESTRQEKAKTTKLAASYQELLLDMRLGSHSTYGTSDLLDIYGNGTAVMYDWKTGYGAVEDAETNAQVQAYTLGAFTKFPQINELEFYIVSPRRQEITVGKYTRDDIPKITLRLGTIIARAKELAGKVFNPTEKVCDYCANQGSCQALADKALVVSKKAGFEVPETITLNGTSEEKGQLLKLANLLEGWAEETKKELLRQAVDEGTDIAGYKLEQRRTPRTIDNPLLGYDAVKDVVSVEEYLLSCTRVSVPQLEKFVSEKAPRGKKAEAKQHLEDLLRSKGAFREEGTINVLKPKRD